MAEEPEAVDTLFESAVDALRDGDQPRAKKILTDLLKADQNNATYWVWMSAAVETAKERIYCLETAIKIDPNNATAKRGLILHGALPPDESIQPFPLNRPRAWESKLLLAHEIPRERGLRATMTSPAMRLAGVLVFGAVLFAAAFTIFYGRRTPIFSPVSIRTSGPTPTFTLTPTFANFTPNANPAATKRGPTPLAILFGVYYTVTPIYVNTPLEPQSQDIYRAAEAAIQRGDWDTFISSMNQIATAQPDTADVPFLIAEGYRSRGECSQALSYYNQALQVDGTFAPAYLGLARARLCIDGGADPTDLYKLALQYDPNYGEVYLDRANYNLHNKNYNAALPDLAKASGIMPNSALVQLGFAQAYLLSGDNTKALAAAQKANSIDLTLLPSFFYLGEALVVNGQYADAIKPLETYLIYQPADGSAEEMLGEALAQTGQYQAAIDAGGSAVQLDPNQVRAYIYMGNSYLALNDLNNASVYYKKAIQFFPDSFDANIGLTQVLYKSGTYGNSYLQAETSKSKATNPTQLALAIYWRALSQEGRQSFGDAIRDWKLLLSMSPDVMTPEMRQTATDHLKSIATPTITPKPSATPKVTKTPTSTNTPRGAATQTPSGTPAGGTPTPSANTPTPTKTP
jgi:tetratricopeptide (TPR) repeat protein